MAGNYPALLIDQWRPHDSKYDEGGLKFFDIGRAMNSWVILRVELTARSASVRPGRLAKDVMTRYLRVLILSKT